MDFTLLFITVNKYRFCISVIGYINVQIIGISNKKINIGRSLQMIQLVSFNSSCCFSMSSLSQVHDQMSQSSYLQNAEAQTSFARERFCLVGIKPTLYLRKRETHSIFTHDCSSSVHKSHRGSQTYSFSKKRAVLWALKPSFSSKSRTFWANSLIFRLSLLYLQRDHTRHVFLKNTIIHFL